MRRVRRERAARSRARRKRRVQLLYSLIAAVCVLIVLLACLLRFGFSSSADEAGAQKEKRFTSVLITYEMSAWDYAEKYADPEYYSSETEYLKEVCSINHLPMKDGEIQGAMPGNYLIVPYYAETEADAVPAEEEY